MYNFFLNYMLDNKPEKVLSKHGIFLRRLIHPIVLLIAPCMSSCKLRIVKKPALPKNRRILFSATHGFKDDIVFTVATVERFSYLLFGNLPTFFQTFSGITAWLNGTVLVDRTDKESRKAAKEKMKRVLGLETDLIIYPEGTWNKTENLLVRKLFPGIYDVAVATGAWVVPVATVQEGKYVYASMDEAFDIAKYDREEGLRQLRDRMCTLRYEIMEQYCTCTRAELLKEKTPEEYWKDYIEGLLSVVKCYDRKVEDSAHFQEKGVYSAKEVFAHLEQIKVTKGNAFLLDKRITGRF